ncbi:MAG TPA: FAD-binding oxidoreductase [Ktedonobacteraceae bacterium]|nr:FAD-binding oxidoreductase [Ktedonobacteraceae bacterium]
MRTASIVIIGGGIFGANLAYVLAKRGVQDVVLLEQDTLATGSSGKATGGLRQQFADELDIRCSVEGIRFYEQFVREYIPVASAHQPPRFYQYGYMFLCTTPESWRNMQRIVALQQSLGVPTQLLSPAQVSERVPQLVVDDVSGATFCPTDGYSNPGAMARALADAASARNVTIQEHTPVTAIQVRQGKVVGVTTPRETIATPLVVNATGASAALVARLAGIDDLPIWPLKRQLYLTEAVEDLPENVPMVVDLSTGFHFRRRDEGVILTLPLPVSDEQVRRNQRLEPAAFALDLEESLWPLLHRETERRCPTLARASLKQAWAGLYEMTPDEHPILGPTAVEGFLCGCGFSGHGFMHSPWAARLLAEFILGETSHASELELFSLDRFSKGKLIETTHLL